ncbi:MAG: trigger factor [Piscinibacter sp.]
MKLPEAETEVQAVFDGKADLDYTVSFEVLPTIELADFKGIKVEKPVVEPADAEVDEMLAPWPSRTVRSRPRPRARPRMATA